MCLESYLDKKLTFPWVHFPWNEMNKNKKMRKELSVSARGKEWAALGLHRGSRNWWLDWEWKAAYNLA